MSGLVEIYRPYIQQDNKNNTSGEVFYFDQVEDMLLASSMEALDKIEAEARVFEDMVEGHSLEPGNVLYNSNAMCGEAGEVANIAKKMQFEKLMPQWIGKGILSKKELKEKMGDELGDTLFYLTRLALDNDFTLEDIIKRQMQKINKQSRIYGRKFLK